MRYKIIMNIIYCAQTAMDTMKPNDVKNVDNNNERDILSLASGINSVQTMYVIAPDATPYPIGNNDLNDSKNINDGIAING